MALLGSTRNKFPTLSSGISFVGQSPWIPNRVARNPDVLKQTRRPSPILVEQGNDRYGVVVVMMRAFRDTASWLAHPVPFHTNSIRRNPTTRMKRETLTWYLNVKQTNTASTTQHVTNEKISSSSISYTPIHATADTVSPLKTDKDIPIPCQRGFLIRRAEISSLRRVVQFKP